MDRHPVANTLMETDGQSNQQIDIHPTTRALVLLKKRKTTTLCGWRLTAGVTIRRSSVLTFDVYMDVVFVLVVVVVERNKVGRIFHSLVNDETCSYIDNNDTNGGYDYVSK